MANPSPPGVTVDQALALFGIARETLRKAEKWGYVPKPARGTYPLPALVRGFARYLSSGEMTITDAGALLGVSDEWVRRLIGDGYIKRTERGTVLRDDVAAGYIRWLKDEDRRSSKTASASRRDEARTREIEQRIAERDGRLIDLEEHEAVLDEIVGTLKAGLVGLPASVTRDLELRAKIETAVDGILTDASARLAKRGEELRSGRSVIAADGEDDA
jgi:hypothetical protein